MTDDLRKKHSLKRPYRIRYQKPDLLGESRTEWQQWDAPWEYEGLSEEEKEAGCLRIALMKTAIISRPFVIISRYSHLFVIHWNKSVS